MKKLVVILAVILVSAVIVYDPLMDAGLSNDPPDPKVETIVVDGIPFDYEAGALVKKWGRDEWRSRYLSRNLKFDVSIYGEGFTESLTAELKADGASVFSWYPKCEVYSCSKCSPIPWYAGIDNVDILAKMDLVIKDSSGRTLEEVSIPSIKDPDVQEWFEMSGEDEPFPIDIYLNK